MSKYLPWIVVVVALLFGGFSFAQARNAERARVIAENNERAARDITRKVVVDQSQAISRLQEQATINAKSLDAALQRMIHDRDATTKAVTGIQVAIDSIETNNQRPTTVATVNGTNKATFTHTGPPIEGHQEVTVDSTGKNISLDSHLRVTPFTVTYALGCDKRHAPVASFQSPSWVQTSFTQGTVDPGVCNPPKTPLWSFNLRPTVGNFIYAAAGGLLAWTLKPK